MLAQLAEGVRTRFPVILTYTYVCDQAIVSLLGACTIGNSPTALCHNLQELHSEEWMRNSYVTSVTARDIRMVSRIWDRVHQNTYQQLQFPTFQNPNGYSLCMSGHGCLHFWLR